MLVEDFNVFQSVVPAHAVAGMRKSFRIIIVLMILPQVHLRNAFFHIHALDALQALQTSVSTLSSSCSPTFRWGADYILDWYQKSG